MRVISRFAGPALDESAPDQPDQRVKIFKELARLRASEPGKLRRDAPRPEFQVQESRNIAKE